MTRPAPHSRSGYPRFQTLTTRWGDNDAYGHVNNAVYYTYFDSAVNAFLVTEGLLDIAAGAMIGLVVENQCSYFAPLTFPAPVEVGMRVASIGRSSVRYELGLFDAGAAQASAQGYFVHVYVDRVTRRPVELPAHWRAGLGRLQA